MPNYVSIINGKEVMNRDESVFKYDLLKKEACKAKRKIVYRGENYQMVFDTLNIKNSDKEYIKKIHEKIFMIGVKAKFYGCDPKIENTIFSNTESTCVKTFNQTFNCFKNCFVAQKNYKRESQRNAIAEFQRENIDFVTWLLNLEVEKFTNQKIITENEDIKLYLRDYLFYFLHTISAPDYYSRSVLISTSNESNKALDFVKKDGGGLVYEYLIPLSEKRYAISHKGSSEVQQFFDKNEVPRPQAAFFPKQNEYSIKRALFPHYILSVYDQRRNIHLLNPMLDSEQTISSILENGFALDQGNFEEVFRSTTLASYGEIVDGKFQNQQTFEMRMP